MATIRTLVTVAATLCATLLFAPPPVEAQSKPAATVGPPLRLIPPLKQSAPIAAAPRKPQHIVKRQPVPTRHLASHPLNRPHIMRGSDTVGLIARLPWWGPTEMQTIHYPDQTSISQVLATADAWFLNEFGESGVGNDEQVRIVAADEFNELDLAADNAVEHHYPGELLAAYMPLPTEQSWLQAYLAMFAGAFAAASVARYLLV
jgi:hypothetical protein